MDLTATLTPSAVVVSNETQNYVWSGAGKLSGTTGLTKQGAGSLTIANSGVNDNSGTTTIEAGTLQVGNGGTSGNLNSAAIANSGALVFNRSDTITAANVINGAGRVEKQGAGSLTLSGASSAFTGPVAVNAGTLRVGNASALGTGAAGTTVGNGATLDVAGVAITAEPVTVAGDGVGGNGAIVNTVGGTGSVLETLTSVTLAGDTTFGGSGRWDLSGTLAGNGYKLTKVGINELWIAPTAGDTGLGDIDVRQGVLGFEGVSVSSLGDPSKTATVFPGAVLAFYALNNAASPFNKVIAMNGGIFRNANGDNYFSGPVTLSGANTFDVGSTNRQLGVIGGPGSLFKTSGGILILAADNTYSGGTLVSAGVLRLGNGGASGSVTGTIINNSRVDIERSDTYTQGFNLTGTGGMYIRSPNGVVWDGSAAINLGGTVEVGREIAVSSSSRAPPIPRSAACFSAIRPIFRAKSCRRAAMWW